MAFFTKEFAALMATGEVTFVNVPSGFGSDPTYYLV